MGPLTFNMRYLKTIFKPFPSFFDVLIGGFLLILSIPGNTNRAIFIVFYTIFLFIISLGMTPKRKYRSASLSLIALISLLGLFIHNFTLYHTSRTSLYPAAYIMEEGFIYILFSIVFLRTVIVYSTNIRFIYFLIPVALMGWIPGMIRTGNSTPIVAIGLSILIYLYLIKKTKIAILVTLLGLNLIVYKWAWLCMKFRCRPYVWYQLLIDSFYNPIKTINGNIVDCGVNLSPFLERFLSNNFPIVLKLKPWLASIIGSGFPNILNNEYVWVNTTIWNPKGYTFGWVHMQNDYLHFAKCLGPIVLIPVIWWIVQSVKAIGIRPILILFMFVCLICCAKLTMFSPGTAGICLMITALCISDGIKKGEELCGNC